MALLATLSLSAIAVPRLSPEPNRHPPSAAQPVATDQRGTDQSPLVVKVLPSPETQEETAEAQRREHSQSSADWWMVRLSAMIAGIGLLQTIVFGIQAYQLRQTIRKMDEIAGGQTRDMHESIQQATRAAVAMEGVSTSMATNVERLKDAVKIQREIADRQKLISEMQLRAYVSVVVGTAIYQERSRSLRFEGRATLVNTGGTPAHKVVHITFAGIFPNPLPKGFEFPKRDVDIVGENIVGPQQNRILSGVVPDYYDDKEVENIKQGKGKGLYIWGHVTYEDAFGYPHETNFCQMLVWLNDKNIMGYYMPNRNNAT